MVLRNRIRRNAKLTIRTFHQMKIFSDLLRHWTFNHTFLQRTGEIEPTEYRFKLIRVVLKQRTNKSF